MRPCRFSSLLSRRQPHPQPQFVSHIVRSSDDSNSSSTPSKSDVEQGFSRTSSNTISTTFLRGLLALKSDEKGSSHSNHYHHLSFRRRNTFFSFCSIIGLLLLLIFFYFFIFYLY